MPKIIFITGVCGSGKSSLIPYLKTRLPDKQFDIHDFDERGVPDNANRKWRLDETRYWLNIGETNIKRKVSTIITGFSSPDEIKNMSLTKGVKIIFCLLDASPNIIRKRLNGRYLTQKSKKELKRASGDTLEQFIKDNTAYTTKLRKLCKDWGYHIINTNNLNPKEVSTEIVDWIKKIP